MPCAEPSCEGKVLYNIDQKSHFVDTTNKSYIIDILKNVLSIKGCCSSGSHENIIIFSLLPEDRLSAIVRIT